LIQFGNTHHLEVRGSSRVFRSRCMHGTIDRSIVSIKPMCHYRCWAEQGLGRAMMSCIPVKRTDNLEVLLKKQVGHGQRRRNGSVALKYTPPVWNKRVKNSPAGPSRVLC
jgi:hypothetical protein